MNNARSFNYKSNFNLKTEILIVGTLTAPLGMVNGYFYSGPYTYLYSKLDYIFDTNGVFKKLKMELMHTLDHKEKIIDDINRELEKRGIAFFDVIDECSRVNKFDPSDSNLINKVFATEFFNNRCGDIKFYIFTSGQAKKWFLKHIKNTICINEKNSVILKLRGKSNEKEIKEKLITNNILKGVNNDK